MPRRSASRVLTGIPGAPQVVPYAAHGPRSGHRGPPPGVAVPPLAGALTREWQPPFPLDWSRTLGVHRRGRGDPAYFVDDYGAAWRTSLTPDGPATMRVHAVPAKEDGRVTVYASAWGPGAAWFLGTLPGLLGAADDPSGFEPVHPLLQEMSR